MILAYCSKVILCSGLLFGYYMLALRNKRFHEWNRYYLLLLPLVSLIIPLLKIPLPRETSSSIVYAYTYQVVTIQEKIASRQPAFTLPQVLTAIYSLVAFFLLAKLLFTSLRIVRLAKRNTATATADYTLITLNKPGSPFSFLSYIFWSSQLQLDDQKGRQMLQHEIVHVRQKHTLDKLYMHTISALGWVNPFFFLTSKELSLVHEFIADKHAAGKEVADYAETILQSVFQSREFTISNDFLFPPIKRRIIMLTSFQKDRFSYLRRIMVLPVSALIFCSFAFVAAANPAPFDRLASVTSAPEATAGNTESTDSSKKTAKNSSFSPEKRPSFPGGEAALSQFLAKNVRYPREAQEKGIQGTVEVAFIVEMDGSLSNILIANKPKLGGGLEEEAIRVIKAMPHWNPAIGHGSRMPSPASLPIRFVLQDDPPLPGKQEQVYTFVQTPPSFPGGDEALNKYMAQNIKYPKEAIEKKISGTVFLQFVVDAQGKVKDIKSVGNKKGGGLEEEAIRMVKAMPAWIPGKHEGKNVAVQFNLPVRFSLKQ
ncbi:M56 family metallopeptidase [Chitinophaga sp. Cy-1792]|uniref:M56 family metallopeptidase n=1 Tax=Chitinophaga sp. Cy-1792 TaxID=2608339 RepID=UPI001421B3DC|nr:M56 family metallopeptidase [Chitinophaga sp. Cy-1792]NIG57328.1 TonB family protein [Chitinophaga sp. Cy-1792]